MVAGLAATHSIVEQYLIRAVVVAARDGPIVLQGRGVHEGRRNALPFGMRTGRNTLSKFQLFTSPFELPKAESDESGKQRRCRDGGNDSDLELISQHAPSPHPDLLP